MADFTRKSTPSLAEIQASATATAFADGVPNPILQAYGCLVNNGFDGTHEALRILVNEASKIERDRYLQAKPYERSSDRVDYANGYKSKTVMTRLGAIEFDVPQVREAGFYPSALERGSRTERAINLAMAEMYVQGVSTRKVILVLQKLLGNELAISSTQVSRATAQLDAGLQAWRTRPLGEIAYLMLDARYERVREAGHVVDHAVLIATGITPEGKRRILGVSVSLSEAEVHWRAFLNSLIERGMRGVRYIVSDNHLGLKAARCALFAGVPWQRCQFHLQQNAQKYISRLDARANVARQIRDVFSQCSVEAAQRQLTEYLQQWRTDHPKLASWAEDNLIEGLTVFALPEPHRVRMRTTNGLERINKEIKRRTRVATMFPNSESCLRLVSAILAEQDEAWLSGVTYLNMDK
jgi:putative transposase